jgi:hypothetical protein
VLGGFLHQLQQQQQQQMQQHQLQQMQQHQLQLQQLVAFFTKKKVQVGHVDPVS